MGERNAARALAFVMVKRAAARSSSGLPFSALQSALFNAAGRAHQRGDYERPLLGMLRATVRIVCKRRPEELAPHARLEISPTGPMFGPDMHAAGDALVHEQAVLAGAGLSLETFARHAKLGAGTRRSMRVRPAAWRVCAEQDALTLSFELPPGAYATAVLREITKDAPANSEI